MNQHSWLAIVLPLSLLIGGCRKETETLPPETLIVIGFEVDGHELKPDTMQFRNAAGFTYSVTRLEGYLSDFRFYPSGGGDPLSMDGVWYFRAFDVGHTSIVLPADIRGHFDSIRFAIGLDSASNVVDGLPANWENIHMAWPVPMGGGYHFLKLEGHYRGQEDQGVSGYAMHLGTNAFRMEVLQKDVVLQEEPSGGGLRLIMNVNEWFCDPSVYDFVHDGSYSMGQAGPMQKLAANGWNVFQWQ